MQTILAGAYVAANAAVMELHKPQINLCLHLHWR